jgi:site-specific DNA-cytosine methylase
MSDPCSRESEASTSASSEPDTGSSGNARQMRFDELSCDAIGPTSHALRTWRKSTAAHGPNEGPDDLETWESTDEAANLSANADLGMPSKILISSAEDSPARTSRSPDDEPALPASDPACSLSSPESPTLFSDEAAGSSLKTYPDYLPATAAEISRLSSRRWATSGFMTSPGECWTADTSECHSGGAACSSLLDVIEADVHARFCLSRTAAAGILTRAARRGRQLPESLVQALTAQAGAATRNIRSSRRLPDHSAGDQIRIEGLPAGEVDSDTTSTDTAPTSGSVRRLTPTECERLQGLPDGWTVV